MPLFSGHILLAMQIIAHAGLFYLIIYGLWWQWLFTLFMFFLTGCLGMSITYHRLLSHRSFDPPLWFKYLGVTLGTIGLTGTALTWPAVHREHHLKTDREGDPHSPTHQEWWRVQFLSMYSAPRLGLVKDLLRDKFIVAMHRYYLLVQLLYCTCLYLIDPMAVIYLYLAPAAILWQGGSLINTIGHIWGYRNFDIKDQSRNNPILGIVMWGEGWHNNHHANPRAKSFSVKPFEFDLSGIIISQIEKTETLKRHQPSPPVTRAKHL